MSKFYPDFVCMLEDGRYWGYGMRTEKEKMDWCLTEGKMWGMLTPLEK